MAFGFFMLEILFMFFGETGFVFKKCLTDCGSHRQIHKKYPSKKVRLICEWCLVGCRFKPTAGLIRAGCLAIWNFTFSSQCVVAVYTKYMYTQKHYLRVHFCFDSLTFLSHRFAVTVGSQEKRGPRIVHDISPVFSWWERQAWINAWPRHPQLYSSKLGSESRSQSCC